MRKLAIAAILAATATLQDAARAAALAFLLGKLREQNPETFDGALALAAILEAIEENGDIA